MIRILYNFLNLISKELFLMNGSFSVGIVVINFSKDYF